MKKKQNRNQTYIILKVFQMGSQGTTVYLQCEDGVILSVKKEVAQMSKTISDIMEDMGTTDEPIILHSIKYSNVLQKIIDYCEHYYLNIPPYPEGFAEEDRCTDITDEWDKAYFPALGTPPPQPIDNPEKATPEQRMQLSEEQYIKKVSDPVSRAVMQEAYDTYENSLTFLRRIWKYTNYLDIPSLFHLICCIVANMVKKKNVHVQRRVFRQVNDFTPDEEAALRKEFEWSFDDEEDANQW